MWSGLGGKAAERWAALLTSPALLFWIGGVLAYVWANGGLFGTDAGWSALAAVWTQTFGTTTPVSEAVLAVCALLLVAGSARLADLVTPTVLRLLEGYWGRVAGPLTALRGKAIDRKITRWRDLARRRSELSNGERQRYQRLNAWRVGVPADPRDRMPTRLGNLLKAAESRPRHRYGLDAVVCWPRLWLVMPEAARTEVTAARARLDEGARLWLWSLLFCVWAVFTWWALAFALLGMIIGYRTILGGAAVYGRLVLSCHDLYRKDLYTALGWELPADAREEIRAGQRLTAFLERGPQLAEPT
ncbi:hypothetical protein JJ691_13970 [Kutzneria sp. CA-103260]|nr:hypothetical protein JJ691_13970 [Kutzneria sp. CA-103260]